MAGNGLERLRPVEVIAEFGGLRIGLLAREHFGRNGRLVFVNLPQGHPDFRSIAGAFRKNIACSRKRIVHTFDDGFVGDTLVPRIDIADRLGLGIGDRIGGIGLNPISQWGQSFFGGDGRAGPAFRTVGSECILQLRECGCFVDRRTQHIGHQLAFFEGFNDRLAPGIDLGELEETIPHRGDLHFIQLPRHFLPIPRDKRHRPALRD